MIDDLPALGPAIRAAMRTAPLLLTACATTLPDGALPALALDALPRRYVCERAASAPVIDGRLDDVCWQGAGWSADFVDIEGGLRPRPRFRTRAKMCWDDAAFYIAVELEEPHVWATLTARDSVIFYDNDFEVFIDPDGDTHSYCELEINAYGTEWDLFLVKPYRDAASPALHGWDIAGLRTAVHVDGTIDDPSDQDRGWSVEIAIPWPALAEVTTRSAPPDPGDVWRVGFSRVQWRTVVEDGRYRKELDPATGEPYPENNWVWSPQGVINMHCPESWGLVLFGEAAWPADLDEELAARHALRQLYHAQKRHAEAYGAFTVDVDALGSGAPSGLGRYRWPPRVWCTETMFEAVLPRTGGARMHITDDGRIWVEPE